MNLTRSILLSLSLGLLSSVLAPAALAQPSPPGGGLPPGGDQHGGATPPAPDSEIPEQCRPAPGELPDPFCMAPPPDGEGGAGGFPDFPSGGPGLGDYDFDDFDLEDFLTQFDPSKFGSFDADDLAALPPELMKGLDLSYIQNLNPELIKGLDLDFLQNLNPSAFAGFTPAQIAQMTGLQWAALDHDRLSELSPDAIQAMGDDMVKQLNPTEFRAMPSSGISKMMVNFDPAKFTADDARSLLPEGWTVESGTGRLSPPPGAAVVLRELNSASKDNLRMPALPDLDTGLAIGGNAAGGTVLLGLTNTLKSAVGEDYSFEQVAGILKVRNGPGTGAVAAFIADGKSMKQAMPGALPGIAVDDEGKYVLTTPEGLQIPIIPSLQNPDALLNTVTGMSITIEKAGDTLIEIPGQLPMLGIPDPFVQPSTLPTGIHRNGDGPDQQVIMVYPDGSSQLLNPMIQDRESFTNTAMKIPQIRSLQIKVDGSIVVDYEGQLLRLRPAFDISPGTGGTGEAAIQLIGTNTAQFINAQGKKQVFYIQ